MRSDVKAWGVRALGIAVLLALVGGEAVLPGTYLSRRDTFRLHLPLREFVVRELDAGRFPTWNDLDGLGVSVPGTAIAAVMHPLQVLLAVLPPDVALKWQVLLCLVFAGLGAGLLARRLGGTEATWWLAGIAYATSGYLVSSTDNFTYLHGAALLPWALFTAERLAQRPSLARAVGLGGVLALGVHGGDVQGALVASLLASVWAVAVSAQRKATALHVVAAGVVTVLLTAPLLPAIAATALASGRAAGLSADEVLRWSLNPLRLLELPLGPLVPIELLDFHGVLLSVPLGGHTGALWSASEFVGVAVLVLAPLGLVRSPSPSARRFGVLAVVGLSLALGSAGGIYPLLLKLVPGWSAFRYPEKMMPLAVLGLAVLAARGASVEVGRAHLWSAGVLGAAMLPFAAAMTPDAVAWAFTRLNTANTTLSPELAEALADGLRARGSAALLVCLALGLVAWRRPASLAWVAVGAMTLQAAWCARGLMETRPREDLALTPTLLGAVQEAGAARTRLAAWPERYTYKGERFAATAASRRGDFEALAPDHNVRFGVANLYAYMPGAAGEIDRACSVRPQCTSACARRLGAQLCIVAQELVPPMVERGAVVLVRTEQPRLALLRDERARAWASFPGIKRLERPEDLRAAFSAEGDAMPALLLGATHDSPPVADGVTGWQRLGPALAEVQVTLEAENVLVVAEQCARGWRARVDGEPVAPLRVDGGLCAVPVPAGSHLVQLRYVPPGWPWAWGAFVAGVLGCAVILARARRP